GVERLGDGPRGLDDGAVLYARWARGLARAAIQAGVDVLAEIAVIGAHLALVDLSDLVNPPARRIGLVAQAAIRRTVIQAQSAVDAFLEQLLVEQLVERVRRRLRCRQRSAPD